MVLLGRSFGDIDDNHNFSQLIDAVGLHFHQNNDKLGFLHSVKRSYLCLGTMLLFILFAAITTILVSLEANEYGKPASVFFMITVILFLTTIYIMDRANNIAYKERIDSLVKKLRILARMEKYFKERNEIFLSNINNTIAVLFNVLNTKQDVARSTIAWVSDDTDINNIYLRDRIERITSNCINDLIGCIANLSLALRNPLDSFKIAKMSASELEKMLDILDRILDLIYDQKIQQYSSSRFE